MKTRSALCVVIAIVTIIPAAAAQQGAEDLELTRSVIRTERQEIIAASLSLDDHERSVFWPLYADYRAALDRAVDRRVTILTTLAEHFDTLTDQEASDLLNESFTYQKEVLKVRSTYAKKMLKVLPGKTVARFFQIEYKLDAVIEYELSAEVPLVE